jgi:dynein heavy chain
LDSAKKLVEGLAGENKRWKENVKYLKENKIACIGDSLLASAFVSYIGAFSTRLRLQLWKTTWINDLNEK